jgi:hypothetical protein
MIVQETSWCAGPGAGGEHLGIRLEECPYEVIRDLVLCEKNGKALVDRLEGGLYIVYKEAQMLFSRRILGIMLKPSVA